MGSTDASRASLYSRLGSIGVLRSGNVQRNKPTRQRQLLVHQLAQHQAPGDLPRHAQHAGTLPHLIPAYVAVGLAAASSAAAPATSGALMLVPLSTAYESPSPIQLYVDITLLPGAARCTDWPPQLE